VKVHIITIFPEYFEGIIKTGIIKIAQKKGVLDLRILNLRDFTDDPNHQVDDYPYGGGPGMIMKPEPIFRAVMQVKEENSKVILLSPQGKVFNQKMAFELSKLPHLIFICGRYKGVDGRVREYLCDWEISIGDYILSGGEAACAVILEAVVRLIKGVVGDYESIETDSFVSGLLDATYYTRPREFMGYKVPDVLLSGKHEEIRKWRRKSALLNTLKNRPDLLKTTILSEEDQKLLKEIEEELQ
jgi:tRNA (guanine37-N1)-methyltransferase